MTTPRAATVGRGAELTESARFLDEVASGPAGLLLEGHAGIGKSVLWRATATAAVDRGYQVVSTTAAEAEFDLPFVALRDLLDPLPADLAAALPTPQLDALEVALLRSDDPHAVADHHAVCVAALGVVRALAERDPVVLAVDDVDWLDRASERVLRYVVRRLAAEPVGVLVARRPYGDRKPPLGLADRPRYRRITVGPLAVDDLHTLLVEQHGLSLPPRTVRRIHELSAGNPFIAVELARAVRREGRHVLADAVVSLPNGAPAVTEQHIAVLSPGARAALAATALVATPTVGMIDAVEAAPGDAHSGLDEAVAAGLLEIADDRVHFIHPLLRRAVAARMSAAERRSWHRTLAHLVVDPDERAVHLAAATLGPDEDVARALDESAARAMARGAPDTAAALAVRAVDLTPEEPFEVRARRRIQAAEYRYRSEDFDPAAADLTELVAQLPAGELRAEAVLWLATVRQAQNGVAEAIVLSAWALAEAQTPALRAAAERDLALALVIAGQVPDADRHAQAALATARSTGDPVSIAESEAALAWTRFWLGAGLRRDLLDAARSRPLWTRFAPQEASPGVVAGLLLSWADEVDEARSTLTAEDRRFAEAGEDRPRALVRFSLCELECRAGNGELALRHAEEGTALAALVGDAMVRALLLYARGLVDAHGGRTREARVHAEAAITLASTIGASVAIGFAAALLGFVELTAGDHDAVHQHLGPLVARLPADGRYDPGLARFVPDEVEALVARGEHVAADALLEPFEAQAIRLDRPWALGAAGRCRALLQVASGDTGAALASVTAALAAHDLVALPFERARTELVAGTVRRRARQVREARAALDDATAVFERLGAREWADRARAERARIGGRAPSGPTLTEAERRIAELVVAGRTNREVASELFLTVSTVEAALSKIYRKLGVRSRTELATHASRARRTP